MNKFIKTVETSSDREARIIISDRNWLEDAAVEQLKKTMAWAGMCIGVGMPDLHPGRGQPIGAAFVTRDCIYPHLVGSDIGCGMGLWQLDVPLRKVKLDKWEKQLSGLDENWDGDTQQWLQERNIVTHDSFLLTASDKLGTIGSGNHFAEFQQVSEVVDSASFNELDIDKQSVMLLVHSGSRGLGQKILRNRIHHFGSEPIHTKLKSERKKKYMDRHDYALSWAVANRELIAERFCQRIKTKSRAVLDVTHNMVEALNEDEVSAMALPVAQDHNYWIHRKGACPTNKGMVLIPGSRGSLTYLVKPKVSELSHLAKGGFSVAHGAGRKWKRSDAKGRLEGRYKAKDLEQTPLGSRVICKQRDLLYEEAPQAYKNISHVIDDLVGANMIDVVATFKPILTYKTRRTS